MIDWIEENIDPPGLEKKNRGSIFKTIGDIMAIVLDDAKKAYNAHFPYLADEKKLEEHGRALSIPHLMHDKPEEYRNRVTAASFFLMKAGERGFIMDLLKERFDDRFKVTEEFLQLHTKVADLTDEEKRWVLGLLDSLIDPNVSLELSEWLRYIDHITISDIGMELYTLRHHAIDTFGEIKCRDGTYRHNGSINRQPVGFRDDFGIKITRRKYYHNGIYKRNGTIPNRSGGKYED